MSNSERPSYIVEENSNTIHVSIPNQKDWRIFTLAIFYFLCLGTIAGLLIGSAISLLSGESTPFLSTTGTFLLLVFGLILFSLFFEPFLVMDSAFPREDLLITSSSLTVEKSGFLMLRKKKVIPIEKIRWIRPTLQLSAQGNKLVDLFMNTLKYGKLTVVTRQLLTPVYQICRGLSTDEAKTILDLIQDKFPQYH